jgi:hypothetical protein
MKTFVGVLTVLFSAAYGAAVDKLFKGSSFLGMNGTRSHCQKKVQNPVGGSTYGENKCPCVGIAHIQGYFATQQEYHMVQYPLEMGATCAAWEDGLHPKCKAAVPPAWCKQKWCYVDPCNCDLDVVPKKTTLGLKFQGQAAFWSYRTCGGTDFFTADVGPKSCTAQKDHGACIANPDCGWDGKQCIGKDALSSCDAKMFIDENTYGKEDCRCVGINGHKNGQALLAINDHEEASYPPGVGATCGAWEDKIVADCMKDGPKPKWCSQKWCYVDPCKCSLAIPPKTVMNANGYLRYQGKTVYWSYATCGSVDQWSSDMKAEYCVTQTTEKGCKKKWRSAPGRAKVLALAGLLQRSAKSRDKLAYLG